MPKIEHAGHKIEVTPYVKEAVKRLGLFRPDAVPYLAKGVVEFFNHGKTGYELRRSGEELSDDEKVAHGLTRRTRMSRKYWNALTDEGRAEPINAPEIVFRRIRSNLNREGNHRQLDASYAASRGEALASFWERVTLETMEGQCCAAAMALSGEPMPTPDRPRLPLPECDRNVCQCRYNLVRRERAARQENAGAAARPRPKSGFWGRLFGRS